MKRSVIYYILTAFCLIVFSTSCTDDDDFPVTTNFTLENNQIIISGILDTPYGVTFNKIKVEITGYDWQVIDVIESTSNNCMIVLPLPTSFEDEKLQKVVRDRYNDYSAYWLASTDNTSARVAGFENIYAYKDEKLVGRLFLSDWNRIGSAIGKSWIYYQYANQDFTLSRYINKPNDKNVSRPHQYVDAIFHKGWNAYSRTNVSELGEEGNISITTAISSVNNYRWRFEALPN